MDGAGHALTAGRTRRRARTPTGPTAFRQASRAGGARRGGFTLIEIVAVLVITAALGALAAVGIASTVQAALRSRRNAETAQKAQAVIARLDKELTAGSFVIATTTRSITFQSGRDLAAHTVSWAGTAGAALLYDAVPLTNDVHSFSVAFDAATNRVDISLTMAGAPSLAYACTVYP